MAGEQHRGRAILLRDAALEKLRRANRVMLATSVAVTAIITEAAASSFPGTTRHSTHGAGKHPHDPSRAPSSTTSTTTLQPPSEPPASAPSHEPHTGEAGGSNGTEAPAEPSQQAPSQPSEPAAPAPERPAEPAPPAETHAAEPERSEPPVVSGGS
jgi:hypothetical protein